MEAKRPHGGTGDKHWNSGLQLPSGGISQDEAIGVGYERFTQEERGVIDEGVLRQGVVRESV